MIRFSARFPIAVDDVDVVDSFTDRIMEALLADDGVADPDLTVSMTERVLELHLLVATDDPLQAVDRGNRAIVAAFAGAARSPTSRSRVLVHGDVLGPSAAVRTELVSS